LQRINIPLASSASSPLSGFVHCFPMSLCRISYLVPGNIPFNEFPREELFLRDRRRVKLGIGESAQPSRPKLQAI